MTSEDEPRRTSESAHFRRSVLGVSCSGGGRSSVVALSFGASGTAGLTAGIGTIVLSLACFVAMTVQIRKGRGPTETPPPGGRT